MCLTSLPVTSLPVTSLPVVRPHSSTLNTTLSVPIYYLYLLLVARNLWKYILLLFIFLVLRHIALLVASLVVARNWSLSWAWFTTTIYVYCDISNWSILKHRKFCCRQHSGINRFFFTLLFCICRFISFYYFRNLLKFCKSISESKLSSFGNSSSESVLTVLLFKQSFSWTLLSLQTFPLLLPPEPMSDKMCDISNPKFKKLYLKSVHFLTTQHLYIYNYIYICICWFSDAVLYWFMPNYGCHIFVSG